MSISNSIDSLSLESILEQLSPTGEVYSLMEEL